MGFSEYRIKAIQLLYEKYDMLSVLSLPTVSRFRLDDICADHWRDDYEIMDCVNGLEAYLVTECGVQRL